MLSTKRAQTAVATAVLLVLGLGPARAVAGPDVPATPVPPAAKALHGPPGTVAFDARTGTQSIRAVSPGAASLHIAGMTNASRRTTVIWVRYRGYCADARSNDVPWPAVWKKAVVPGDPNKVPGVTTLTRHVVTLPVPSQCAHDARRMTDGYFAYDLTRRRGAEPYGTALVNFVVGFRPSRYRANLLLVRDKPAGGPYQAHHTLPKKFASWFKERGIENIHETTHLLWWCSRKGVRTNHQAMAHEYNRRWQKFKNTHPTASPAKILRFRDSLLDDYVYACP